MRVIVAPPDPAWPAQFEQESLRVRGALTFPDVPHRLHHIGSTSIMGIFAKPVIDMLLEVHSLAELDRGAPAIVALGYQAMGEFGIPGRRYFRKDDAQGLRTHQIHAFEAGSAHVIRHLAFRDYMNAHPEAAKAYSDLKRDLAVCVADMDAYMDGKDAFIHHHQALAVAWYRMQPGGSGR